MGKGLVFGKFALPLILMCLLTGSAAIARAADVEMKIVGFPEDISRYSPFYVRVRISNKGNTPVRGCDASQDKCIAVGWEFAKSNGAPATPGSDNMAPIPAFINDFLPPGESMEKSIRIIPLRPPVVDDYATVTVSLLVRESSNVRITQESLKLRLQDPTRAVRNQRGRVRFLVYTYFFLAVLIIGLRVFNQRDQA